MDTMKKQNPTPTSYWIHGIHAVHAALHNPNRTILKVIAGDQALLDELRPLTKLRKFHAELCDKAGFNKLLGPQAVHQGIAAQVQALPTVYLEDILTDPSPRVSVAILDQITDPHNIGAIIRSAAAFGIRAVVAPQHNTSSALGVIAKSASGACEKVSMITVPNLARCLEELKKHGFWCVGLDGKGTQTTEALKKFEKIAIVLGAEGSGLRKLTQTHCDLTVRITTAPDFCSLNVSNAAAIAFFAIHPA